MLTLLFALCKLVKFKWSTQKLAFKLKLNPVFLNWNQTKKLPCTQNFFYHKPTLPFMKNNIPIFSSRTTFGQCNNYFFNLWTLTCSLAISSLRLSGKAFHGFSLEWTGTLPKKLIIISKPYPHKFMKNIWIFFSLKLTLLKFNIYFILV